MFSVNRVELEGTAVTGVEMHSFSNGAGTFASFFMRVEGFGPNSKPQYFEITMWNDNLIAKAQASVQRDVPVRIEGSIASRSYQKKDGSKALNYSIKAFSFITDEPQKEQKAEPVQQPKPLEISDEMLPF